MSYTDYAIDPNVKAYVKSMFKELLQRLVSINVLTQPQADAGFVIIDTKYG